MEKKMKRLVVTASSPMSVIDFGLILPCIEMRKDGISIHSYPQLFSDANNTSCDQNQLVFLIAVDGCQGGPHLSTKAS